MTTTRHLVEVEGLSFGYGGPRVLDDISLTLRAGEMTTVIGPNGSGKSTLLKVLVGPEMVEHRRYQGTIVLNGTSAQDVDSRSRAQHLAYLPQEPPIVGGLTVAEVVELGRHPHRRFQSRLSRRDAAVQRAMATCDVTALAQRRTDELSGGERQRVMLAAALAQDTPVLLLDEPTSALDVGYALHVLDILEQTVADQRAVLLASHDVNLVSDRTDELIVLQDGRIVAAGPPRDILTAELFADVYGVHVDLFEVDGRTVPLVLPRGRLA